MFRFLTCLSLFTIVAIATDPRVIRAAVAQGVSLGNSLEPRVSGQSTACQAIGVGEGSTVGISHYNGQANGCPYKNRLDEDGSCKSSLQIADGGCAAYCEVRNYWFYGPETDFDVGDNECTAYSDCTLEESWSATITNSFSFDTNVGLSTKRSEETSQGTQFSKRETAPEALLKFVFNLGASYTWSQSSSKSVGVTKPRPSNTLDTCGYWTIVPYYWASCGTMTTAPLKQVTIAGYVDSANMTARNSTAFNQVNETLLVNGNWTTDALTGRGIHLSKRAVGGVNEHLSCDTDKVQNTANYCNFTPYKDQYGVNQYAAVFVLEGCNSIQLQPKEYQSAIFQYPGVAKRPFADTWQD